MDMMQTVAPKSDQMNADDLIGGPRSITVTRVSSNDGNPDQPVNVFFEGDSGKPYRPCKQMRRVMIAAWGSDASKYVGRSMTLYRDPAVTFGGMAVGGIRISHMSHIDKEVKMALTASKTKRALYTVKPLAVPAPAADPQPDTDAAHAAARAAAAQGKDAFNAWWNSDEGKPMRAACKPIMEELAAIVATAEQPAEDEEMPL